MQQAGAAALVGLAFLIGGAPGTDKSLVTNSNFEQRIGNAPIGYRFSGNVSYQYVGEARRDASSGGGITCARKLSKGEVSPLSW
jgi:hypothetical protein